MTDCRTHVITGCEERKSEIADEPLVFVQLHPAKSKALPPAGDAAENGWQESGYLSSQPNQYRWRNTAIWDLFWNLQLQVLKPYEIQLTERFPSKAKGKGSKKGKVENYVVYRIEDFNPAKERFKVAWVNYPAEDDTWEPCESLQQAMHTYCWRSREAWTKYCQHSRAKHPAYFDPWQASEPEPEPARQLLSAKPTKRPRTQKVP